MQDGPGTENSYGASPRPSRESVPILVMPGGYARRLAHIEPNYNATLSMRNITKSAEPLNVPADIPNVMRRAFSRLRNGRGGPVLVEIPHDVWDEEVPEPLDYRPVLSTRSGPDPEAVEAAVEMLVAASRPVIYAGQGVHYARAWPQLRALAERLGIPVCTSLEGKSAFPENHALALGSGGAAIPSRCGTSWMPRTWSSAWAARFTETPFGVQMPKGQAQIHATLDPDHVNKDYEAEWRCSAMRR